VNHDIKLAQVLNFGVIYLDLVSLRKSHRGGGKQSKSDPSQHEISVFLKEFHFARVLPVDSVSVFACDFDLAGNEDALPATLPPLVF
jgi:hypothetical protein